MRKLPAILFAIVVAAAAFAQHDAPKAPSALDKKELAMIATKQKEVDAVRAKLKAKPTDANLKKTFIDKAFKLAEIVKVSPALGSKQKYPRSLRLYREVVKVDPKHKQAKENVAMIEGIYKQMGLPIPR